jgi:hypothetical protein
MSEYIEIEAELDDDGAILFETNLALTAEGREETYDSAAALEEGSPVAQALSLVPGIAALTMRGGHLTLIPSPDADYHALVADVTAALKEFFL